MPGAARPHPSTAELRIPGHGPRYLALMAKSASNTTSLSTRSVIDRVVIAAVAVGVGAAIVLRSLLAQPASDSAEAAADLATLRFIAVSWAATGPVVAALLQIPAVAEAVVALKLLRAVVSVLTTGVLILLGFLDLTRDASAIGTLVLSLVVPGLTILYLNHRIDRSNDAEEATRHQNLMNGLDAVSARLDGALRRQGGRRETAGRFRRGVLVGLLVGWYLRGRRRGASGKTSRRA